jgi:hypothetical protein
MPDLLGESLATREEREKRTTRYSGRIDSE